MPKRGKGERRIGECAYCGVIAAIGRDHVPPENLFPRPLPQRLITVPVCDPCHDSYNLTDERFRLAITLGIDGNRFPKELEHSVESIKKLKDPKKVGLRTATLRSIWRVPITTRDGKVIHEAVGRSVDARMMLRTVERIARGLCFEHEGRSAWDLRVKAIYVGNRHQPGNLGDELAEVSEALVSGPGVVLGNDVLRYNLVPFAGMERASVWLLQFYGHHTFVALVNPIARPARFLRWTWLRIVRLFRIAARKLRAVKKYLSQPLNSSRP